jgi:ABC-type multidrug transport system fused ATPase/permease subunit
MKKEEEKTKPKLTKQNLKNALKIFSYIKPYSLYFIIGIILLFIGTIVFMIIPDLCGELLNVATGTSTRNFSLTQIGLFLMLLVVIQAVTSFFRVVLFAIVSEKGMADVRKDLYNNLIGKSFTFFESRRVGELTSRITTDVEKLQSAISISLAEFLRQVIVLIGSLVYLAYLAPKLSLIMLLTFPVVIVLAMVFGRYIKKLSRERQDQLAKTNTIVEESFQNFSIVKAFTNEAFESKRYQGSVNEVVKISLSYARYRGLFFAFIITLLFGCILFILWQGAGLVQAGEMEAGNLLSFVLYTVFIGSSIAGLGNLYTVLAGAVGATERIQELLESESEVIVGQDAEYKPYEGLVKYSNVNFSYPTRRDIQVLKSIDLQIDKGEKVALVGQSGSGKSTIIQLLMRFYELDNGSITIDGKSITELDLINLRNNIGVVPQDVLMFGGTIKENIAYGNIKASDEEIMNAAQKSNCLEFIENFPEKFETIVGERGIKLSGGQKQRIAIARAILKNPTILILDEATSSLDAESEKLVQEALDRLMEGRTSIIIAHRLATIRDVDRIYVLENGVIVEQGDHEALMQLDNGVYQNLAQLQFETN